MSNEEAIKLASTSMSLSDHEELAYQLRDLLPVLEKEKP